MANSVGQGALVLSTNNTQLDSGLAAASAKVQAWAGSIGSTVKSKLANQSSAVSSGITSMLSGLKGGLVGVAASFGLSALDGASEKIRELGRVGRNAGALGMDVEKFQGLSILLRKMGIEGEAASKVFLKVGHSVQQAASGSPALAAAFAQIGVNAKELAGQSLDEQFINLLDALNKMPEGAKRADLMMQVFGRQAGQLAPLMGKSREEIAKFINEQKQLGNVVSGQDMETIKRAAKAQVKIKEIWSGFSNKILVAVAPVIEFIWSKISQFFAFIQPTMQKVMRAVSTYWELWRDVVSEIWDALVSVWNSLREGIATLFNFGETSMTVEDVVISVFKGIGVSIAYCWDVLKAGAGAIAYVAGLVVEGFGKISSMIAEAMDNLNELPESLKPDWLKGAIAGSQKLAKSIKDTGNQMQEWGKSTWKNFGKSAEQVEKWFENRKKKTAEQGKELGDDLVDAMNEEIAVAGKAVDLKPLIKGSKEAFEFLDKWTFEGQTGLLGESKKQTKELQKANEALGKIANRQGVDVEVV